MPISAFESTLAYLESSAALVLKETGLLPHLNPGVMDEAWLARLRKVSVSQGIMLETASERLSQRGGPHFGSPDKVPAVRLATLEAAGRARVPFTTGILIGIGETRAERIEALLAIRDLHERYGHIQEIIIQNFRAKPDTRMADAAEPSLEEHVWTIAAARLIFGPAMNIQAPPNLRPEGLAQLVKAGINDWGGVSPVTPDHVNPEAPWPHLADLEHATERAGRTLVERLAIYPEFLVWPGAVEPFSPWGEGGPKGRMRGPALGEDRTPLSPVRPDDLRPRHEAPERGAKNDRGRKSWPHALSPRGEGHAVEIVAGTWIDPALRTPVLRHVDAMGLAREEAWAPGTDGQLPAPMVARVRAAAQQPSADIGRILDRVAAGEVLSEPEIVVLFQARGRDFTAVCQAADLLRAKRVGDLVTYVVNRNINYTNICTYGCKFCAFSKGRHNLGHRDAPYDLDLAQIAHRTTRSLTARRHRGVPAGRHRSALHRRDLSVDRRRREIRRRPASTCTPSRRWKYGTAPRRWGCRSSIISRAPRPRDSPACPARPRRSSTTRCAPSSAPTSSRRPSGSR